MTDVDQPRTPSATRALTWTLLVLCTVGNLALSAYGGPLAAHLVLGVATLLCIAGLVVPYLRPSR
jgi:hypothetical protein